MKESEEFDQILLSQWCHTSHLWRNKLHMMKVMKICWQLIVNWFFWIYISWFIESLFFDSSFLSFVVIFRISFSMIILSLDGAIRDLHLNYLRFISFHLHANWLFYSHKCTWTLEAEWTAYNVTILIATTTFDYCY